MNMENYGKAFLEVGNLYRLKIYGSTTSQCFGILFYAAWTTRAQHRARCYPNFRDLDVYGGDWGWDISLLFPENDNVFMFLRHHTTMSETLEKVDLKQPGNIV